MSKGDLTARRVAAQRGQNSITRIGFPSDSMISVDSKGDGADGVVVGGGYSLGQCVHAVIQTGQRKQSLVGRVNFHRNDIFRAVLELFGQSELCTFQRLTVLIDLVHDHLVGKDDDVIPRGCARAITARVVGVLQLCLVDVAVCPQNSVIVQFGLVGNGNGRISSNTSNIFQIIKYDLKGAFSVRRSTVFFGKDLIIGIRDYRTVFIAEMDFHRTGVKGQTLFFHIVESVVIRLIGIIVFGNSALQAEGDVIADVVVGRILPVRNIAGRIVGVLQLFLKFGNIIALRSDGNSANNGNEVSGIRLRARQRAILVLDQVVTASNFNRTAVYNGLYRIGQSDIFFDNGKLSFVACTGSNGGKCVQNSLLNSITSRTSAVFAPLDVGEHGRLEWIIITGKDLVDLVGVTVFRCGDRVLDNSSSAGRAAAICKRRDRHGANHSNCQQRSHEFLHCFFHGKSPFLFSAPCRPLHFAQGGGGVVLFGLSRKLCAGRAGVKPRASGREVQFSHLPSLRVCACGG